MSGIGDIKDDIVIIFKERVSGPLGYIILSFIAYNWSWFYFLIFSTKTAESKINTVLNNFERLPGFLWPLLIGTALALSTPFIRVGMIKVTAVARKLEDVINYQIKNNLDDYTEKSKLELVKTREEIIERESRLTDLISKKNKIDGEIKINNEKIETLREDENKLHKDIEDKKREIHMLGNSLAELRLNLQDATNIRERLYEKSTDYSILRRSLITFRNEIKKVNEYFSDVENIHLEGSSVNIYNLKEAAQFINEKMKGLDGEYFKPIGFEFKNSNKEVVVSPLKHINLSGVNDLLTQSGLPSHGHIPNSDNSITFFFKNELTEDEKSKLKSLVIQYIENN